MADKYRALNEWAFRTIEPTGRALVVGSRCYDDKNDRRSLYAEAVGVDMLGGKGVDIVHNLERPLPESVGLFGHLDCVSVLEHVRQPFKFCRSVVASLTERATVLICTPWVWRVHGYPNDYWRFTPAAIAVLFPDVEWIEQRWMVHGSIVDRVPRVGEPQSRYHAKSELVMVGRLK